MQTFHILNTARINKKKEKKHHRGKKFLKRRAYSMIRFGDSTSNLAKVVKILKNIRARSLQLGHIGML